MDDKAMNDDGGKEGEERMKAGKSRGNVWGLAIGALALLMGMSPDSALAQSAQRAPRGGEPALVPMKPLVAEPGDGARASSVKESASSIESRSGSSSSNSIRFMGQRGAGMEELPEVKNAPAPAPTTAQAPSQGSQGLGAWSVERWFEIELFDGKNRDKQDGSVSMRMSRDGSMEGDVFVSGLKVASVKIAKNGKSVAKTMGGKEAQADSAAGALQEAAGWALPLDALAVWISDPKAPRELKGWRLEEASRDAKGLAKEMRVVWLSPFEKQNGLPRSHIKVKLSEKK